MTPGSICFNRQTVKENTAVTGSSGKIGPERAGAPPQTSPLPPERELRQFLGQRMLLDRSTESLCDAK